MKTIAFFNNKGGVGKTSLVYHIAWMMSMIGISTLAADLDPQSNLTSAFLEDDQIERMWNLEAGRPTIYGAIEPRLQGVADVALVRPAQCAERLHVLPGDLMLAKFEDKLATSWIDCHNDESDPSGDFYTMRSLWQAVRLSAADCGAAIALIDVGPNVGALNRAALIGADHVVVPLGADLFSLQGLSNLGPTLQGWRAGWQKRRANASKNAKKDLELPSGAMAPLGYVVLNPSVRERYPVKAYRKWADRIPERYATRVLQQVEGPVAPTPAADSNCLAMIKHYKSLMPMAQEQRKPMFLLKAADGAVGGHAGAVQDCFAQFEKLAQRILSDAEIST
ncbi:MAG: AAA family ATPase [Planctomycetota bacterium]|nr:AAA family ATPase [Planctomycetota bacterium]